MVEEDDYVVLNKPPGVQVTPTVDNMLESCLILGAKVLAALLHRLCQSCSVTIISCLPSLTSAAASMASVLPCAQAIGREEPLLITHRLDTCTEGVLIMGKTKAFVQQFNAAMMSKEALQKTYKALTRAPLSPGVTFSHSACTCSGASGA